MLSGKALSRILFDDHLLQIGPSGKFSFGWFHLFKYKMYTCRKQLSNYLEVDTICMLVVYTFQLLQTLC